METDKETMKMLAENPHLIEDKHLYIRFAETEDELIDDFMKLRLIDGENIKANNNIGVKLIHKFFTQERINTIGRKKHSFVSFLQKFVADGFTFPTQPSYMRLFNHHHLERKHSLMKSLNSVFSLYSASINGMKPTSVIDFFLTHNPSHVLDPFAGWGGRLIASMALDCDYTGIDNNKLLERPYAELIQLLSNFSNSKVKMIFENCLDVDLSQIEFDFLFTSPPYYNFEKYRACEFLSKNEWNDFYTKFAQKYWDALKPNGIFAINIHHSVLPIFLSICGNPIETVEMKKKKRTKSETYKENIYVWKKTNTKTA